MRKQAYNPLCFELYVWHWRQAFDHMAGLRRETKGVYARIQNYAITCP